MSANQLLTQSTPNYSVGLMNTGDFEHSQRVARMFAVSKLVPKDYQGDLPSCVIALNMAARIGADPLMVMQNLVIVHGKPTWSSQFLIATFNTCGRFSSLRYEFFGEKDKDSWGCRAVATELATGEKIVGTDVTIAIAKAEGWYDRKDKFGKPASKWKTMPQQMLMYRAASWFVRANAPEISMGLHTQDEIIDIEPSEIDVTDIAENVTEKEKPTTKTRAKSRSIDTLLGGTPVDEIKEESVAPVLEDVIEAETLTPESAPVVEQPTVEPPQPMDSQPAPMATMPIPELEPENPKPYVNLHDQWRARIDNWKSLSDIALDLQEMPPVIKMELKPYYTARQDALKAELLVDVPHWTKRISECNSREQFMNLQNEMPEAVRNDARIKESLSHRENFGMQNNPDNW